MDTATPDVIDDVDLKDLLDAAVPPPACEWKAKAASDPCGEPATWIMSASCGHSAYFDDEHVDVLRRQGIGDESTGPTYCGAKSAPRHKPMLRVTVQFDRIAS